MKRTRIKICGITREEDVDAAVEAGVDALGFVFYANSARYITPQQANVLAKRVPPFVTTVGLFVNPLYEEIAAVAEQVPLTCLQLHGDEKPEFCSHVVQQFHLPVIRAARVNPDLNLLYFSDIFIRQAGCSALLLDAWSSEYGGAGQTFDWSLIPAEWKTAHRPFWILSGGLNAQNVVAAVKQLRPAAVDVSSGVEAGRKGFKEARKIQEFIAAVHAVDKVNG